MWLSVVRTLFLLGHTETCVNGINALQFRITGGQATRRIFPNLDRLSFEWTKCLTLHTAVRPYMRVNYAVFCICPKLRDRS
jgi:hypothetical protein